MGAFIFDADGKTNEVLTLQNFDIVLSDCQEDMSKALKIAACAGGWPEGEIVSLGSCNPPQQRNASSSWSS